MSTPIAPSDLTQRPPRSMRARLGGFVLLPRILDKGRATLVGKNGEYNYNSPTDQHLVRFLGLDLEALLKELANGKADGKSSNGFGPTPRHCARRGKSKPGQPISKSGDRTAMPKPSPASPNTWGNTPQPAKTSRRGSTPSIWTTSSASAGNHNRLDSQN
jgi:hypothetical protein